MSKVADRRTLLVSSVAAASAAFIPASAAPANAAPETAPPLETGPAAFTAHIRQLVRILETRASELEAEIKADASLEADCLAMASKHAAPSLRSLLIGLDVVLLLDTMDEMSPLSSDEKLSVWRTIESQARERRGRFDIQTRIGSERDAALALA